MSLKLQDFLLCQAIKMKKLEKLVILVSTFSLSNLSLSNIVNNVSTIRLKEMLYLNNGINYESINRNTIRYCRMKSDRFYVLI